MTYRNLNLVILLSIIVFSNTRVVGQNPLIRTQYTADPSARVFGDRVYVYPSHDILATPGKGRADWFNMEDYHVFSSANLTEWTDHGMIVQQNKVPWVKPDSYSMWAPDCIYRNGKYYFYFPSTPKDTTVNGRGFTIGVATADKPEGPYTPEPTSIKGVRGIDPNVFMDKDGQAYLYWSQGNIYAAKLKENMLELASEPVILQQLPGKGLKEGPYMLERNGKYYLTYPHVENKIERLEYAMGDNPLGPFKFTGVIMDESATDCWTNHHSIIQFKNHWYLFYHDRDYSPNFDKARSIRADSLFFEPDGTIRKVVPSLRGIGVSKASDKIQIDRYSRISNAGATIDYLDTSDRFQGWKAIFNGANGWLQYNSVDFGKDNFKRVTIRARAKNGGNLQIYLDGLNGTPITTVKLKGADEWQNIQSYISPFKKGLHHLIVASKDSNTIEVDWVQFE